MLYYFRTLFIKIDLSWLTIESIKALEIKTSMSFNLDFASNTILSYFFFYFLIIDLYFLIRAVIAQTFISIAEVVIPTGIPTKKAKGEMEIHPVIAGAKIRKRSM